MGLIFCVFFIILLDATVHAYIGQMREEAEQAQAEKKKIKDSQVEHGALANCQLEYMDHQTKVCPWALGVRCYLDALEQGEVLPPLPPSRAPSLRPAAPA